MFERFTERARRVVVLAQEEARRLSHNYIGTEHMLLALLLERDGLAARTMGDLGVSLEAARARVLDAVGTGQTPPSGHMPFTPRTKKMLELSLREALTLGHEYISTEHLLLGLIREGGGVGAKVLAELSGDLRRVRTAVIAACERPAGVSSTGPAPGSLGRLARHPVRVDDPVVPREAELARLLTVLARRERNNALIVGPHGAGKSALVRELAQLLAAKRGPASLGDAQVVEVELSPMRNAAGYSGTGPGESVVVVEDLDALVSANDATGGRLVLRLAGLAGSAAPLIVTATERGRGRFSSLARELSARFEVVALPAADHDATIAILRALRPRLDEFHRVAITDDALAAAAELGARVRGLGPRERVLPGSAVDLLDAAAARLSANRPRQAEDGERRPAVLDERAVRAEYEADAG